MGTINPGVAIIGIWKVVDRSTKFIEKLGDEVKNQDTSSYCEIVFCNTMASNVLLTYVLRIASH
jgi:hypothetical protein